MGLFGDSKADKAQAARVTAALAAKREREAREARQRAEWERKASAKSRADKKARQR